MMNAAAPVVEELCMQWLSATKCKFYFQHQAGPAYSHVQEQVMTRPGDIIAGGSGGMGPCPPQQHQPPGIYHVEIWFVSGIYLVYIKYLIL